MRIVARAFIVLTGVGGLIGYSHAGNQYVAHWCDTWGGKFSADAFGKRVGDSLEFRFHYPEGIFFNTFTFGLIPTLNAQAEQIVQSQGGFRPSLGGKPIDVDCCARVVALENLHDAPDAGIPAVIRM